MNISWVHIIEASALASFLASLTDWYFFGIMFHDRYHKHEGVWRTYIDKKDEIRSITAGTLFGAVTTFIFVVFAYYLRLTALPSALAAAGALWVMIPVPLLLGNSIFLRIDRALVVSHSLGWLARLLLSALCASWLL